MENFDFRIPTEVLFGKGQIEHLADAMRPYGDTVLLCYGGGSIRKNGVYDDIQRVLKGFTIVELSGIEPNPRISTVIRGRDLCRKNQVKIVLAAGGGSVLDCAKMVADCAVNDADPWEMVMNPALIHGALPVFTVLTLAATGSEMSNSSVITNDDDPDMIYKLGIKIDYGRIKFALLDPMLTATVPAYQTACGSTDIMMHTFERYFHQGYALDITDELSYALIRSVIKWTPVALETPDDYDARANLMWAGSISHNGLMEAGNANPGDWGCHQMEHEISAEYDVAHGAGLAAIWGSWARYVLPEGPERFSALGEAVFGESDPVKTIEKFEEFFHSIGMPTDIKGLGLDFDEAACRKVALGTTFNDGRTIGNFKVLGTEDVFNIMMMASGLK